MSETVAATKDDVAHLQQLIRELVAEGSTQSSFSSRKSSSVKEADGADGVDNFDQISYSITQIFQSGKEIPFTEQLNFFINRKEAEIEKMCNFHYQEFVQSVDQLLKVRVGTASIRTKLNNLNKEIQQSGSKILDKRREIVEFRRTQVNIESTIESLQSCLFILNIMGKIQTQINSKKYYSALRMLEDLQSNKIKLIKDFKFMEHISGCIPKMKQSIIDAVVKEMNEWFVK
ncbi:uncharacterized protein BJ171DRAFT_583617 [Polychytrium aggregatum]|uniref:uncharacterized protein n=1 Tax=Polychytrium aggregatum TaxID=110093 RepID=UPI0022FEC949|nr:uncharacterized protein BJ171DRAFT_583617 [Polychytrium aggregatum]KAI9202809.1 hypothetical protein BJ171DRAFT_583617 [Polychytrium aggregatum]